MTYTCIYYIGALMFYRNALHTVVGYFLDVNFAFTF